MSLVLRAFEELYEHDYKEFLEKEFNVHSSTTHYAIILATTRGDLEQGEDGFLRVSRQARRLTDRETFELPGGETIALESLRKRIEGWKQQQAAAQQAA